MKRFPSIKKNTDFRAAYDAHDSKAGQYLIIYKHPNDLDHNRLGVSAGRKVGNSIVRHTLARKMREIFRLNNSFVVQGFDIVVVVRNKGAFAQYRELEKDYLRLMRDHNIIMESK